VFVERWWHGLAGLDSADAKHYNNLYNSTVLALSYGGEYLGRFKRTLLIRTSNASLTCMHLPSYVHNHGHLIYFTSQRPFQEENRPALSSSPFSLRIQLGQQRQAKLSMWTQHVTDTPSNLSRHYSCKNAGTLAGSSLPAFVPGFPMSIVRRPCGVQKFEVRLRPAAHVCVLEWSRDNSRS